MATKIYVGNLPYTVTEDELREVFAEKGTVLSANIVTDRETGRSRGFGFVEMEDAEAAAAAIEELNGAELQGRKLVVNEARPREERGPRRGGARGGYERPSRRF
ncbi:MAG TPA: RNA-binding protein [Anaerolineae bacterium]|nr:RNA-binding protein [Anaerolineae bacterium]